MDTTIALSRGGKDGLAASSGSVFKGKSAFGPALSPAADAVGMKSEPSPSLHVGNRGVFVQEYHQACSLLQVSCGCASTDEASGFREELFGKTWAIAWRWAGHVTSPWSEKSL